MLSTFSTTLAKAAADVSERVAGEIEEFKNEAARREWEAESVLRRLAMRSRPQAVAIAAREPASRSRRVVARRSGASLPSGRTRRRKRVFGSREDGSGTTPAC